MSGGLALGQALTRPNLDVVLSPPTWWQAHERSCALMQEELEGLHRARARVSGAGLGNWERKKGGRMGWVRTGIG